MAKIPSQVNTRAPKLRLIGKAMSKYVQMLCFFIIPSRTCRKRHIKTLHSTTSICCRFFSVHAQQLLSDCQFSVPWILVSSSSSNEDKITLKSTGSWGFRIKMGDLRKFIADSGVVEHSPITSPLSQPLFQFQPPFDLWISGCSHIPAPPPTGSPFTTKGS